MANTNDVYGARIVNTLPSSRFEEKTTKFMTSDSDPISLFIGDFVKLTHAMTTDEFGNEYPIVTQAAAGETILGVVVGFAVDRFFNQYRKANTKRIVEVVIDPLVLISIQCRGIFTATDVGKEADIYVGSGNIYTGISGMELDASTIGTGNQLKIVGIEQSNINEIGQYTKLHCIISNAELNTFTKEDYWDRVGNTLTTHYVDDNVSIGGKLTVDGAIDPTGLILTPQTTPPSTDNGTFYYNSILKAYQFRADDKWVYLPQPYPVINIAIDFPTIALVYLGSTYRIGTNVTDNNPSKTNTGQSFLAGQEIFWNGTNWTIEGDEALWGDDLTYLYPISSTRLLKIPALNTANGIVTTSGAGVFSTSTALPNGTTATTQSAGDNSTKIATTAFVHAAVLVEDLWDRTGTVLSPHNSGDSISIPGSGILLTLGTTTSIDIPAITFSLANSGWGLPSNVNLNSLGDKFVLWNDTTTKGAIGFSDTAIWFQNTQDSAHNPKFVWYGGSDGVPVELLRLGDVLGFVWNETGIDLDVRFEGDADANLFVLDAGLDQACFGTTTPITGAKLTILGTLGASSLNTANGIVQTSSTGLFSTSTALPNGTTATTQSTGDNSTKVATTAYVDTAVLAENLWDRTGTVLSPHTSGDSISIPGSGILLTLGTTTSLDTPAIIFKLNNSGWGAPSNVNLNSLGDKFVLWNDTTTKGAIGFSDTAIWFQNTQDSAHNPKFVWYGGSGGIPVELLRLGDVLGFVWNETGIDLDARFEGDTDVNLLVLDAGLDQVCIGTATPISGAKLTILGTLGASTLNTANGIVQTSSTGLFSTSTALPNGTTATTQSALDNSTKLATTAYVDAAVGSENLWDSVIIPAYYTVVTPHTATDRIQVPTTGAGGEILYTDLNGNKTIVGNAALMFSGAGVILGTAAPYFKAFDTAGDTHSGLVWGATGDASGYIYHTSYVGAVILDLDAKPASASYDSLIRYGYNTTALHKQHAFYTTTGAVQFTNDAVLITATTAPYLSICATGAGAQAIYLSQVGSTGNLYFQSVSTGNSILYIDAKVADASATSRMLFGYNSSLATSRTYEFYNGLLTTISTGVSGSVYESLRLSNTCDGTTGTGQSLTFYQTASNAVSYAAGGVNVLTEVSWTSTASTRDSKMLFQVSLNGAVGTALALASSKYATFAGGVSSQGFRAESNDLPTTGSGLEMQYASNSGYLAAYDRTNSLFKPLNLQGSIVYISTSAWNSDEYYFDIERFTSTKRASIAQSNNALGVETLALTQADESEGFINFIGSDRGSMGGTLSNGSVRVEMNGIICRIALYPDA